MILSAESSATPIVGVSAEIDTISGFLFKEGKFMKKKLITVLLATALTAALFGCGGSKAEESAPAAAPAETTAEEAPAEEEEAPAEEEEAPAEEEAAPAEEEEADEGSSDGTFSLLDVDESMIDIGVYGNDSNGGELVFTMFTGPDNNKYVSLMGFNNDSQSGDVICGQYEATTETDEDGLDWTYFNVTDVYTSEMLRNTLINNFPFSINISQSNPTVAAGSTESFSLLVTWPYESGNDDADTSWGEAAYDYKLAHPNDPSIVVQIRITAVQTNQQNPTPEPEPEPEPEP